MPTGRPFAWLAAAGAAAAGVLVLMARTDQPGAPIFGFAAGAAADERALEQRLQASISPAGIEADHRFLTSAPHPAGSERDRALADWTAREWRAAGLEDVQIVEHQVLLPYATEIDVEMIAPRAFHAVMREEPAPADTDLPTSGLGQPYLAFSASADVSARVVYAGQGMPQDYEWLKTRGIDVRGSIVMVRQSSPSAHLGYKAFTAERLGAAGLILFSDSETHIQRGSIAYDFLAPGDQLHRPRPHIVAVPMSAADARRILEMLGGPVAPRNWAGGLPLAYRVGPGPATVRLRVRNDDRVRPIWTVTGRITGSGDPDRWVVLGNHRDAWTYGGVDPSTGSASLMALVRALGGMAKDGVRPKRTILFASWDGGEFAHASSTEWGEQFARELTERAVAYLNVEVAASGSTFTANAVPALNRLIEETVGSVVDPNASDGDPRGRAPLADAWRHQEGGDLGTSMSGGGGSLVNNRLDGGADYAVFLNFLGIPIADLTFSGRSGVARTRYDTHRWVAAAGDPGFRYQAAMSRVWGVMALRLANADLVPLDYRTFVTRMDEFLTEAERTWRGSGHATSTLQDFTAARAANRQLANAADRVVTRGTVLVERGEAEALRPLNESLVRAERGLVDPGGLVDRPWYRHQIYAPAFAFEPKVLPGLAEAIEAGDPDAVRREEARIAAALTRVAEILKIHVPE